jgi:hypothetical protein
MKDYLFAIVMGPISDGETAIDQWPIDPSAWHDRNTTDGKLAAFIAEWLSFDNVDWLWITHKARSLGRQQHYRRLVVAISHALQDREVLFKHELVAIAQEVP